MMKVRDIQPVFPHETADEATAEHTPKRLRESPAMPVLLCLRAQTDAPDGLTGSSDPAARKNSVRQQLDDDAHVTGCAKRLGQRLGDYSDAVIRAPIPSGDEKNRRRTRARRKLVVRLELTLSYGHAIPYEL